MKIRKCSYKNRLLHRELGSSVDVCVQGGSTPGSITKEMVNCGEISWENVHLKDQETEERRELKTSWSNYPNSQQFSYQH
jgi:hypothetical protein